MKRLTGFLMVVLAAFPMAACASDGESTSNTQSSSSSAGPTNCNGEKVALGYTSASFVSYPLFVAITTGAFDEVGLTVETKELGSSAAIAPATTSGDLDFGLGTFGVVAPLIAAGAPVQMFTPMMTADGTQIVAKSGLLDAAGITAQSTLEQKVQFLKGKKVGTIGPGSGVDNVARQLMQSQGVDPDKDVTMQGHESSTAIAASFVANRIDVALLTAPATYTAINQGEGRLLINLPAGDDPSQAGQLYTLFYARSDKIADHPEIYRCFDTAMKSALTLIHDDPTAASEAARKFFPTIAPDVYAAVLKDYGPAFSTSTTISQESFDKALGLVNASRTADKAVKIEFDKSIASAVAK